MGILALGVTRMIDFGQKGSKSNELNNERGILRHYLYQSLSCTNTIPSSSTPICNGNPFVAIKTVDSSIIAKANGASGDKIGEWMVRARCLGTDQKLLIEASRKSADGRVLKDPLTGKSQDWTDLFPGYMLCHKAFLSTPSSVRTESMQFLGSNGCDSGGTFGGILDVKRRYGVTMTCAAGERAITGGAQCEHMKAGWTGPLGFKQTLIGKGSSMISSFPTPDGKSWYAECCVSTSGILGTFGSLTGLTPQTFPIGFVRCEAEQPI